MDTTTLIYANALLFALCAGVMLANAKSVGGMRGAVWFAGANLCRGAAILLFEVSWLGLGPGRLSRVIGIFLALLGVLLLHQSFAELLERKAILFKLQCWLVAVMTAVLICLAFSSSRLFLLTSAIFRIFQGFQYALVATLVFRSCNGETGSVGWLTGLALASYAIVLFLSAVMNANPQWSSFFAELARSTPFGLMACLLTTAATAFGFLSLSTAKLRLELLWRAQMDDLTGLLNRWALKRMALKEIQRCRRGDSSLALITMDLDGLKTINDTRGHGCGDVVLQAVAGVLQETVRVHDSTARMGGDEFCVLLPNTSIEEACYVAERLRDEIASLVIRYRGETVQMCASLGVASSDVSGLEWQSLADDSDAALYRAKREGRNRVIVAKRGGLSGEAPCRFNEEKSVSGMN